MTEDKQMQPCNECSSIYFASASQMAALCPNCGHYLYGYPNCPHEFQKGRCTLCFWDGSVSAYIQKLKDSE